jgi:hypothetical protein
MVLGETHLIRRKEFNMNKYALIMITFGLISVLATACSLPVYGSPLATPTVLRLPTLTSVPPTAAPTAQVAITNTPNPFPTLSGTTAPNSQATQPAPTSFCADGKVTALINNFKTAVQTSNGSLLASLVSPAHGMEARLYRNGRKVTYDSEHAKFLFDSTFEVNWGNAPASGLETKGSFHELFVPALKDVFNKNYTLTCNQIKVGGTTYQAIWPYTGINYYSVFYPGSTGNGSLDWHTWLLGMDSFNGNPHLYAIMQFLWEP